MRSNNLLVTDAVLMEKTAHWPVLRSISAGCGCVVGIDEAGQAHYAAPEGLHIQPWLWRDMQAVAVDPVLPGLALGLRQDGSLVMTHAAYTRAAGDWFSFFPVRNAVHAWAGEAAQVLLTGRYTLARTHAGRVRAVRLDAAAGWLAEASLLPALAAWTDVGALLCASPDTVYAADAGGRLMIAGSRADYDGLGGQAFREQAEREAITAGCCHAGGESVYCAFLTREGHVISNAHREPVAEDCIAVCGAGHAAAALTAAGSVISFGQEALPGTQSWPAMTQLALGTGADGAAFAAGLIR